MTSSENVLSEARQLQNKIRDCELRVGQVLMTQLQTKKEIDLITETAGTDDQEAHPAPEAGSSLPDTDDPSAEELEKALAHMISAQQSMQRQIEETKALKTGLGGLEIFDTISQNVSERLKFLETVESLVRGPLLEEPPEPPEEETPAEEPEPEPVKEVEAEAEKPKKGKKGKKA